MPFFPTKEIDVPIRYLSLPPHTHSHTHIPEIEENKSEAYLQQGNKVESFIYIAGQRTSNLNIFAVRIYCMLLNCQILQKIPKLRDIP